MNRKGTKLQRPFIFSIRTKLILIISTIVILTSATMIVLAVVSFKGDNQVRIQENNLSQAKMVARMLRTEFNSVLNELKGINSAIHAISNKNLIKKIFFPDESNIIFYGTAGKTGDRYFFSDRVYNENLLRELELNSVKINETSVKYGDHIQRALNGEEIVLNASIYLDRPVLCIIVPLRNNNKIVKKALVSYISITKLLNTFKLKDEITRLFIVNRDGDILAHSNAKLVLAGGNYINLPIVKMMKKSPVDNGHYRYQNENNIYFLGSFNKIGFADIGVIATAEEEKIYRAVYRLQNIYLYITVIILTVAIMAVYLFCKNITEPIKEIVGAVEEIENGDFKVKITPKTNDELGELTKSIIQMGRGLEERERIEKQNEELVRQNFQVAFKNEQLKELDRMKTNFFANVSHEIRTPLTMILSPVESALQGDFEESIDEDFLRGVQRNAIRLLRLVNNILDFARIEEGQVKLNVEERDIVKVVENYTDVIQQTADSRGITVNFNSGSDSVPLYIDIEKIDRVLMNLISNALKFTDNGGRIDINIKQDSNNCIIEVIDTGIGIPHNKIDLIFDRFSQVDPVSTKKYEGTGIGLALAKEYTLMHGGSITVESSYIEDNPREHGTKFTVTYPLGKEHLVNKENVIFSDKSLSAASESDKRFTGMREMTELGVADAGKSGDAELSPPAGATEDDERKHVLLVEDNRDMRNFLNTLLRRYYKTFEAVDGLDGLKKLEDLQPDLIVTDVMMPNMNGYDMTRIIKQSENLKRIPVIMLTAKADMAHKIEGLEFGADDYVTKPFNSKELLARVNNLIKTYEYEKMISERNTIIENDLQIARLLQRKILPESIPDVAGYRSHVAYIPMDKVGGDFFDFVEENGKVQIFIADVSGHGISGAFLATITKMALKATQERDIPSGVMGKINTAICESTVMSRFVTSFFCVVDTETNIMKYTNCGHVPPIIYKRAGDKFIELKTRGMPLGLFDEFEAEDREIQLEKDDRIILYTDGATECKKRKTKKMFGLERFQNYIRENRGMSPEEFTESFIKHLHEFSGREDFSDDFCLMVFDVL